jgi:hypothetical protein
MTNISFAANAVCQVAIRKEIRRLQEYGDNFNEIIAVLKTDLDALREQARRAQDSASNYLR